MALAACSAFAATSVLFSHSLSTSVLADANQTPKELFAEKCSACHNAPNPEAEAMTANQWQNTVNRMLNAHQASQSISPGQAQTILTYLDTFAVKPGTGGGNRGGRGGGPNGGDGDVWTTDPVYSHVYRFRDSSIIAPFRTVAGKWSVTDSATGPQLVGAPQMGSTHPAILVAPTPAPHGNLQIEAEFRPGTDTSAGAVKPASFGVTFDTVNADNYYAAEYDDSTQQLNILHVQNGQSTTVQSVAVSGGLTATPDGWHKIRVNLVGGRAKVWLDYKKLMDTVLPAAPGNGGVGLYASSRVAARSLILDVYAPPTPTLAPLG